jgi:hypothetical protein
MINNFKIYRINWDTCKLIPIFILIKTIIKFISTYNLTQAHIIK